MLKFPIYFDNHATSPMDPRVLEAMLPYFTDRFGNAASRNHKYGWEAEEAVEIARKQIADLIGASPKEIVFTSGATESDNLAIKGAAYMYREKGDHIITAVTEHKAVIDTCKRLEKEGFTVTYLPVKKDGRIDLDQLRAAITPKTTLITIMAANNEIGVLQPIDEIGAIAKEKGVLFHTDAVQAVGKVPFDVNASNIHLASLTAHKIYGPKGVGALYVRRRNPRVLLTPLIDGGGHERGMRSGTLNVPGIVGFGKAAEICRLEMASEGARLKALRDRLNQKLHDSLDELYINGSHGAPAAGQPEHQLRLRRGRVAADGDQRRGGLVGLGLHLGEPGAVLRAEGPRRRRRARAFLDPFRPGPVQHGRGSGLRGGETGERGEQAARDVAALRDGEGRRGPLEDAVAGSLSGTGTGRCGRGRTAARRR